MKEQMSRDKQPDEQAWWQPAIMMFARLSGWIIAPVLIGTIVGRWLDRKYDTEPWMFLGIVGVAFVISMVGLIKQVIEEFAKIEKANRKNNNKIKLEK
jgi:F0F1-type ATP synthase assembly protein I